MGQKAETVFRERVIKDLHGLPFILIIPIQQVSIRGTPDLLICLSGQFIALELKTLEGELAPLQKFNINRINRNGGYGFKVDPQNWRETYQFLQKISRREKINNTYEEIK